MHNELVKVQSFWSVPEAEIAKLALESEGVSAFLDGAEMGNTLLAYTDGIRGVKLMVPAADAERAFQILADKGHVIDETELIKAEEQCAITDEYPLPAADAVAVDLSRSRLAARMELLKLPMVFLLLSPIAFLILQVVGEISATALSRIFRH